MNTVRLALLTLLALAAAAFCRAPDALAEAEPQLILPKCTAAPVIDGKLDDATWQQAAVVSMLEAYPVGNPRTMRMEQPLFYVCWDDASIYVAMDCLESNTNRLVAACAKHDSMKVIGDDCLEMMITPGHGNDLKRVDLPVYYLALNSIQTVWDARFYPLLAETHNSWESNADFVCKTDGTHWVLEMRIPFNSLVQQPPKPGDVWRMNFARTYYGYHWNAWNARGGLNDARVGANVTFAADAAAVRLTSVDALVAGNVAVDMQVANPTAAPQTVTLTLAAEGRADSGEEMASLGEAVETLALEPGELKEVTLATGKKLNFFNRVTVRATDAAGRVLYEIPRRDVRVPALRMEKVVAPVVPLVDVFPRFLPSVERLAVQVDYTAWLKNRGREGDVQGVTATTKVWPQGKEDGEPVLAGTLAEFADARGVWRASTADLPEGDYAVQVTVTGPDGEQMIVHDDWFVKKIFPWMTTKFGRDPVLPALYEPVKVEQMDVHIWGRTYAFGATGLAARVVSRDRDLLSAPMTFVATVDGKDAPTRVTAPFAVGKHDDLAADGAAALTLGALPVQVAVNAEYDGLIRYRITYGAEGRTVAVDRLRLRVPLVAKYCPFYSAAGDPQGTSIAADVLPQTQGRVYDSQTVTRSVVCAPTWACLFWVGDYDTCFCYAADTDRGWVTRADAPAVEAVRDGDDLVLWLNLVDAPTQVAGPRTVEIAFQAGPVKPLPAGWRGWEQNGDPRETPLTILQDGGSGGGMKSGLCFMGPSDDPKILAANRERLEHLLEGPGKKAIVGYHQWGAVPKGHEATRVFRGEWGIDKATWDAAKSVRSKHHWSRRSFGDNKDNYIIFSVPPVPSYVDYISYAYDRALAETPISGFYDDLGTPKPVFDPELGIGYVRPDGTKSWSVGLWAYRDRWQRAAVINKLHHRPNLTRDSQHVIGHYLPAYNFIGIWSPCERGYYNPFDYQDNLDFYQTIQRYYAYNPSRPFGQPAMIGMATAKRLAPGMFADTRGMMMLVLLHDQDVGSFGVRDAWTVAGLRHARNRFRQWEPDVTFTGWWEIGDLVATASPTTRVSVYRRPGQALLIVGNTGDAATVAVTPNPAALGVAAGGEIVDSETLERLGLDGGAIRLTMPRHDVRVILLAPAGACPPAPPPAGSALPAPAKVLEHVTFADPELPAGWTATVHAGIAGAWPVRGRLCIQGNAYGYAYVSRPLAIPNPVVQCQILAQPQGSAPEAGPSLWLWWDNGHFLQATPTVAQGKFSYRVDNQRQRGGACSRETIPGESPMCPNWVRIALTPEQIVFSGSADGLTWAEDATVARDERFAGPPALVVLGNGRPGDNPVLANVQPPHFQEGTRYQPYSFFDDVVIGE